MRINVSALLVLVLTGPAGVEAARAPRAAVVVDGPSDLYRRSLALLAAEANALFRERFPGFAFPTEPTHVGDFTPERTVELLDQALRDSAFDLVVGIGFFVGLAAAHEEKLPKPLFLPFADPEVQGLPRDGRKSGRTNLAYLTGVLDLERELRRFRDVIRQDRSVFLFDALIVENVPALAALVADIGGESMTGDIVSAGADPQRILAGVPADAEAVYIGPLIRLPDAEIAALLEGLNARRLPTYASGGRLWVEQGAFTTLVPADENQRRMRRLALFMQETWGGARPSQFDTAFERRSQLVINMATARRLQIWPGFDLLTEAELLYDDPERRGSKLSLRRAVERALAKNLDLGAVRKNAPIAEADLRRARGVFAPEVTVRGDGTWIDPDLASPLFEAERTLSVGVTGQQLVYGARAAQAIAAQADNRRGVEAGVQAVELDTVSTTARAYLNVLRARTAERINRDNLKRVRVNLALAEVRVEVGTAGRQEVFRWENEIADSRAEVIQASAARNQTEIALNRLLNRRLETSFRTVEPLDPDTGIILADRVMDYLDDPWSFRVFRDFMAEEARRNAPELRQLRRSIDASQHGLAGQLQELFVPDVFLSGGFSQVLARGGAGSGDPAPIEGIPIPPRVDFQWQVGAGLRFTIFDYPRYPEIDRTREAIRQLDLQRAALALAVEQNVRSVLHQAGASQATIGLRQAAAEAARRNLELVTDAYRQGTVNVITLIDAQNQSLAAGLAAANAVYDFLLDYVAVERAASEFWFLGEPDERKAYLDRLNAFVSDRTQEETRR